MKHVRLYKICMLIAVILCVGICKGAEDPDPNDGMWVDDDWTGYNYGDPIDNHVYGVDAFYKIQDAVECSAAQDVIHVYAGDYAENVNAYKNLEFIGIPDGNGNLPVICPGTLTGIVIADTKTIEITGFKFTNCEVGIRHATYGGYITPSVIKIHGNIFTGIYRVGGGFSCYDTELGGEAIYMGGNVSVYNNLIYNNAGGAGAVSLRSDDGKMLCYNNTIVDNSCIWGSVWMAGPEIEVFNNIITGEQNGTGVCLWDPYGDWEPVIIKNLMYDNIGGNTNGTPISGTVLADPVFLNPVSKDFRLNSISPCIDTGLNSYTGVMLPDVDLDGNTRPVDGDSSGSSGMDIGAFEYQNGDGDGTPVDPDPNDGMWVDDDWAGSSYGDIIGNHVYKVDAFCKIQDAIEAGDKQEVIHVHAGNYLENIHANKDLAFLGIKGGNGALPEIKPGSGTGIVTKNRKNVEVTGFKFTNCEVGVRHETYGQYIELSSIKIHGNIFTGIFRVGGGFNCYDTKLGGEAIYMGGNVSVYNNLIYNNSGGAGAVSLRADDGSMYCYHNTIVNNSCIWGSVWMAGPWIDVFNNIITGEQSGTGIALWDPYGTWEPTIRKNVMYANAGGNTDGTPISESILADPKFQDPAGHDFHLKSDSPCIDNGLNSYTGVTMPSVDLDGGERPRDGDSSTTSEMDVGAYEFWIGLKIVSYSPGTPCIMSEGQSAVFSVSATAPGGNPITYSWKLDGAFLIGEETDSYTYSPGYEDAGSHSISVTISDGNEELTHIWDITVNDVDQDTDKDKKDEESGGCLPSHAPVSPADSIFVIILTLAGYAVRRNKRSY